MLRILVVDDDEHVRKTVRKILTREGYDVDTAGDGVEAATSFKERVPDLIILDVVMPRKGGLETLMALRGDEKPVKAIIITGKAQTDTRVFRDLMTQLGGVAVVRKPFEPAELIRVVNEALVETA